MTERVHDKKTSALSSFYKSSISERLKKIKEFAELSDDEAKFLANTGALDSALANRMIENVIGGMTLPLGVATNFLINDKEYIIPMAIEEPSVVAAASNAAKMARVKGGFRAFTTGSTMIGQIQLTNVADPFGAKMKILANKQHIIEAANKKDPMLVKLGGGAHDVVVHVIDTPTKPMVITHLLVDVKDAMGANAVNTMAEAVAPLIEKVTGGKVYLRIISNLATYRLAQASAVFDTEAIGGEDVVSGIIEAYAFAAADPYRCATHNKGIMNGIDAAVIATGNDFRAVEAGAHSYASLNGPYHPLTTWEKNADGDLVGTIELPMPVGLVGGATAVHPTAKTNIKILGVKIASELAEVLASLGLAQNFAALRALATEGIQRGHMSLHARNIAVSAGATGDLIDKVAEQMVAEKAIRIDRAKEIINELSEK